MKTLRLFKFLYLVGIFFFTMVFISACTWTKKGKDISSREPYYNEYLKSSSLNKKTNGQDNSSRIPYYNAYLNSSTSTYNAPLPCRLVEGQIWNRKGFEPGAFDLEAQQPVAASGPDGKKDILDLSDTGALGVTGFRGNIGSANNTLFLKVDPSTVTGLKNRAIAALNFWKPMEAANRINYVKKGEWYLLRSGFGQNWSFVLLHILEVDPEAGSSTKGNTGRIQFEYCLLNE